MFLEFAAQQSTSEDRPGQAEVAENLPPFTGGTHYVPLSRPQPMPIDAAAYLQPSNDSSFQMGAKPRPAFNNPTQPYAPTDRLFAEGVPADREYSRIVLTRL